MNSKFEAFEQRIGNTQREISQSQISAIQNNLAATDNYTFKKKGREQQYRMNAQVMDKLCQADGFVREASSTVQSEAAEQAITRFPKVLTFLITDRNVSNLQTFQSMGGESCRSMRLTH